MARIASGEIPVRDEDGFLFVDVAPYGPKLERPNRAPHERPPMCTPVVEADDDPLMVTDAEAAALTMSIAPVACETDDEMGPEDETASKSLDDWRAVRRRTSRTRVPPPKPRRLSA
jgi:hypothetical protein